MARLSSMLFGNTMFAIDGEHPYAFTDYGAEIFVIGPSQRSVRG